MADIIIGTATTTTTGVEHGIDVDVTVDDIAGEVTLLPAEDGSGYGAWGQPDHWVSGQLLAALRERYRDHDDLRAVLAELAAEAGDVADEFSA